MKIFNFDISQHRRREKRRSDDVLLVILSLKTSKFRQILKNLSQSDLISIYFHEDKIQIDQFYKGKLYKEEEEKK